MITGWNDLNKLVEAILLKGRLDEFYDGLGRPFGVQSDWAAIDYYPRTTLTDQGEQFELIAELPGVEKKDLQVKIQGNYLEISGVTRLEEPNGYSIHRRERKTQEFTRSFTLSAEVDEGKVKARYKNGLLIITLPKTKATKPRQITIN